MISHKVKAILNYSGTASNAGYAEIGINVVTTCPTSAATAGQVNIYTGAACATQVQHVLQSMRIGYTLKLNREVA